MTTDFFKLWAGQTISQFGSWLGALGLLAILTLDATPAQMGTLATLLAAPNLLIGLLAGVWVDRLRRRPLLIGADLGRALLLGVVVYIAFFGTLRMLHLYVVAFLVGSLTVLFNIAYRSYVPALVERRHLVAANSRLSATESVAEIASPGLGGLFVQVLGAPFTLLLDALSYIASAAFFGSIRTSEVAHLPSVSEPGGIGRDIRAGLQIIGQSPVLRALVAASATRSFFGGFYAALYALYVIQDVGLSPALLGLLVGGGGIGALVAALILERVVSWIGQGQALLWSLLISSTLGIFTLLAAGQPPMRAFLFLLIPQLVGDLFLSFFFILEMSTRQALAPDHALGRINASFEFIASGIGVFGIYAGGVLGNALGMRAALTIAVIGGSLAFLWIYLSPLHRMD